MSALKINVMAFDKRGSIAETLNITAQPASKTAPKVIGNISDQVVTCE